MNASNIFGESPYASNINDAGYKTISNVEDPVNDTDASNKRYVDTTEEKHDEASEIEIYANQRGYVQDDINVSNTGVIDGCEPSISNSSITINQGLVKIRTENTPKCNICYCNVNSSSITPVSGFNYISLNYNNGNPLLSLNTPNGNNIIEICRVVVDNNGIHIVSIRDPISLLFHNMHAKDIETKPKRSSGLNISSSGLNISVSAGSYYSGLCKCSFSSFNSSSTTFYYWSYDNSSWSCKTSNVIDNACYRDSYSLENGEYKADFIYLVHSTNGDNIHVIYGGSAYSYQGAMNSTIINLPPIVEYGGLFLGKVVLKKGDTVLEVINEDYKCPSNNNIVVCSVDTNSGITANRLFI